ncbi:MAG TPA: nuclear transport factor 2 family protein [Chthoniobacterales bacterium]
MKKLYIALTLALLATGPTAFASAQTEVMAPVHQFVDGFNKGATKSALAACADETSIIDEFPPYEWHGRGACAQWVKDYEASAKANGIADGIVTLSKTRHVDVQGDRAYVVTTANYTYTEKRKPMRETGSTFTFALQKGAHGWRIIAWTWSKN